MSTLAVTEITAACNRDYQTARERQSRSVESMTVARFLSRLTGHVRDRSGSECTVISWKLC